MRSKFFFLIIAIGLLYFSPAFASNFYWYNLDTATSTSNYYSSLTTTGIASWTTIAKAYSRFEYTGDTGSLNTIDFYAKSGSGSPFTADYQIKIYAYVDTSYPENNTLIAESGDQSIDLTNSWVETSKSLSGSLEKNTNYWIGISRTSSSGNGNEFAIKAIGNTVYSTPNIKYNPNTSAWETNSNYVNLSSWFRLNIAPAAANSIAITFPADATSTLDFSNWNVSYLNLSTSTNTGIVLNYSASSTVLLDPNGNYYSDTSGAPTSTTSISIFKAHPFGSAEWNIPIYARALLWDYDNLRTPSFQILASSTIISFTIIGENPNLGGYGGYTPPTYPTSTASSTEWVMTCDPNDPFWDRSLCQLASWVVNSILGVIKFLFVPSNTIFDQWTSLYQMISAKPPVGYFYAIINVVNQVGATSKPAFVLAGVSSLGSFFDPIKTGIAWLLWFGFAFWIFNRIRHLDL